MAGKGTQSQTVRGLAVKLSRGEFFDALGVVSGVVPSRSPRPELQDVRITATGQDLDIAGTDLEVGVRVRVQEVEVQGAGTVLVSAQRLLGVVREAQGDGLEIAVDGGHLVVKGETGSSRLVMDTATDYPEVPVLDAGAGVQTPAPDLQAMIRRTTFAAAKEPTRYALNGVLVRTDDKTIHFVATDGKRLAWALRPIGAGCDLGRNAIVATKGLQVLDRILTPEDTFVGVLLTENDIRFVARRGTVVSRLIDGQYPNHEEVTPRDLPRRATLPVAGLSSALRQVKVVTTQDQPVVRFRFDVGRLTLSADVREVGASDTTLAIGYDGEPVEIGFNPDYFLDVLRVVETETVLFDFLDAGTPGIVREGAGYLYVIMPMNLS